MNLNEKYKDDLEALNFISYLSQKDIPENEIEQAILALRKVMTLQDALNIYYAFDYDNNSLKVLDQYFKGG